MNEKTKMHRLLAILFVGVIVIVGCGKEPEPEIEEEPPPPPPTPQEIAAKIIREAKLEGPLPAAESRFPKPQQQRLLSTIQTANKANASNPDGQTALRLVSRSLERRIGQLQKAALWEHVVVHVDAHAILNPDTSRYALARSRGLTELMKPKPKIRGFIQDGRRNENMVMLEIYLPQTQETKKESMRVGDVLHGLRMEKVIGDNKGVVMEYLETGETFEVYTKN